MNKIIIILLIGLSIFTVGCKKSSSTGGGSTPAASNKDADNYLIIDGVTNYHYSFPGAVTVACSGGIYSWSNSNNAEPDYNAMVSSQTTTTSGYTQEIITLRFKNNGNITYYTVRTFDKSTSNKLVIKPTIVNGITTVQFKNVKVYEGLSSDTTAPYKYFNGQCTCNGK